MKTMRVGEIAARMTLTEKCSLCAGGDIRTTKSVPRLGLGPITMADGTHGLCLQARAGSGFDDSPPATCFPSGASLAATWDRDLIARVAAAIAREARDRGVGLLLGPAINIKRDPLCGRNFECLSEDPYLAGELAASYVSALQAEGVGASAKRFAVDNQGDRRVGADAIVDERTLREIYLPAFETVVERGRPWAVACSRNRLNGECVSQSRRLLTEILRREWGFAGLVLTDRGACGDRVAGLEAGHDLEMPGDGGQSDRRLERAVREGRLDPAALDAAAERVVGLLLRAGGPAADLHPSALGIHHAEARRAAAEGMVLLKNDGILPLPSSGRVALVGAFARKPRHQGGGSSRISPTRMDDAAAELAKLSPGLELSYAPGYDPATGRSDAAQFEEARRAAAAADLAVAFVGLTDLMESEGFDRKDLALPADHDRLVASLLEVQPNLVVVLSNGSPVLMPWLDGARAVLEGYLGGQAWGGAAADILSGAVNPSGKLAETFPRRLEDRPCHPGFTGEPDRVEYREGIFVGYRHYDARAIEPLFPFGHGLSYTRFEYSGLELDRGRIGASGECVARARVKNVGDRAGKETVQLYVGRPASAVARPPRELKSFAKVELAPGEEAELSFALGLRSFAHWDVAESGWRIEGGEVEIMVGASSRDIRLRLAVAIEDGPRAARPARRRGRW